MPDFLEVLDDAAVDRKEGSGFEHSRSIHCLLPMGSSGPLARTCSQSLAYAELGNPLARFVRLGQIKKTGSSGRLRIPDEPVLTNDSRLLVKQPELARRHRFARRRRPPNQVGEFIDLHSPVVRVGWCSRRGRRLGRLLTSACRPDWVIVLAMREVLSGRRGRLRLQVGRPPPVDQEVVSLCFDGLRLRKERLKRLGIVGTLLGQPSRKGEEHLLAIAVQGRQTVDQFLTRWLEESAKPRLRPRTFECCRMIVSRHLISGLGRIPLSKLSPHDVQPYMNRKSAAGLSARTVQYHRAVLRRALNQALLWGLIPRNVAPW